MTVSFPHCSNVISVAFCRCFFAFHLVVLVINSTLVVDQFSSFPSLPIVELGRFEETKQLMGTESLLRLTVVNKVLIIPPSASLQF